MPEQMLMPEMPESHSSNRLEVTHVDVCQRADQLLHARGFQGGA